MTSQQSCAVQYATQIIYNKKADWLKSINYDDIDEYDFGNHFIEVIRKPEYVHLYFDFDSIETMEEYNSVIHWLDSLKEPFGEYSIGGYTNDNELFGNLYKYIKDAKHTLSLHAVFYETKIKAATLMKIMTHTKEGYKYEINKLCDPNVYKLNTQQQFRHVLSDKFFNKNNSMNTITAGSFLDPNTKPSHSIVHIRGDENEINDPQWFAVHFGYTEDEGDTEYSDDGEPIKSATKERPKKKGQYIHDIEYNDKLIIFDKDEMLEFLDNFDNCFDTILTTLGSLYHSPYSKEFLIECVSEWYETAEHTNPEAPSDLINRYYEFNDSNKWFFSMLKHLPAEKSEEYKAKYLAKFTAIDFSMNINNSRITYETIKSKRYNINNVNELLNDLRGCVGIIDDRFYLKIIKNNQLHISHMNEDKFMKMTRTYKPFKGNYNINLYQVVSKYCNFFGYREARISKTNEDDVINLFQGFKYEEIFTNDYTIIQPFLDHVRTVICNNDNEKYDYLLCWFANIIQNITVKNGTLPIIHGAQGSGKSIVVEIFGELLGNYALVNVDDLDKVFGKFNGLIGQHLFININEPPESDKKFSFTGKIKAKTTQKDIVQETKGVDSIEAVSWANYSMTTNNPSPVQEEKGNRRYIYFKTNDSKCGNKNYFKTLLGPIQPEKQGDYNKQFMGVLLHYMKTEIDVKDFDAEDLIRDINNRVKTDYNEQLERQYLDLNSVDKYVVDHYMDFVEGVSSNYLPDLNGYTTQGIQRKLNSICDVIRKQVGGVRSRIYKLKSKEELPDLWSIIEYQHYEGDENDNKQQIEQETNKDDVL